MTTKTKAKGKKQKPMQDNRGGEEKFEPEQIIAAIQKSRGLLAGAARVLKCSRTTIYSYIAKYGDVKRAYEETNEATKDFVEDKLLAQISKGNITAIIFYLKTKAKDRGYVERQEHSGPNGGPIEVFDMNQWKKVRAERLANVSKLEE